MGITSLTRDSLVQQLTWLPVMSALGYQPSKKILPAQLKCNKCSGLLTVYPNINHNKQRRLEWVACPGCNFYGDILALACKEWQIDLNTTLRKLAALKLLHLDFTAENPHVETQIAREWGLDRTIRDYWDKSSQTNINDHQEWIDIHNKLGLYSRYDHERWKEQMRPLFGWSDNKTSEAAVRPGSVSHEQSGKGAYIHTMGRDRTFIGRSWNKVLCIPCNDLPGHISGFWFAGRKLEWPLDWTNRRTSEHAQSHSGCDFGLGFYDSINVRQQKFGNTIFATIDPRFAIAIHNRWFKDNSIAVPFVLATETQVYHTHKTTWNNLPSRDIVFCVGDLTADVLAQASVSNAKVYCEPGIGERDLRYMSTWLHKAKESARPWAEVFEEKIPLLEDNELETLLFRLRLDDIGWEKFMYERPAAIKERIRSIKYKVPTAVTVSLSGLNGGARLVKQTDEGWFVDGDCISDVIIVLKEVQFLAKVKKLVRVKLELTYKGDTREFRVPYKTLRDNFTRTVELLMVKSGMGIPQFSPMWVDKLYELAKRFNPPNVINKNPQVDPTISLKELGLLP